MSDPTPVWWERLWLGLAALGAVVLGLAVAQGDYLLPAAVVGGSALLLLYRFQPRSLSLVLLAGLTAGYVVGNRGFAQLTPSASLPLFPGEAVLGLLVAAQFLERSKGGMAGARFGPIDWLLSAWIVLGTARVVVDLRTHGLMAVRDYAMVYYAVFYFLARNAGQQSPRAPAVLTATARWATVLMGGLYMLSHWVPSLPLEALTLRGVPLIYYKDDLVGAFAALGAGLHYLRFEEHGRWRHLGLSLALVGVVGETNNRAAMLALIVVVGWFLVAGRWRFTAWLGATGLVAAVLVLAVATWQGRSWESTPLFEVYERVVSITDPTGQGTYRGDATESKGDNNLFRLVWWQQVIAETVDEAPVFGLGFGYDLAARFQREYYALAADDFNVRSPHSILVTIFGRMGAVGLALFLALILAIVGRTWRAARRAEVAELAPYCAVWAILVSSCFGVVLEGPMGAVIFWTMLGIAQNPPAAPDGAAAVNGAATGPGGAA